MVGGTAGSPAIYAASLGITDSGEDITALSQENLCQMGPCL